MVDPNRPFALLGRELAETLVLLEYLSTRPEGLVWPVTNQKTAAPEEYQSPSERIESDLATPTTAVRRIYTIRAKIEEPYHDYDWDMASEAAFLSRAKSILSELAAPATSFTIAFSSMVLDANVRGSHEQRRPTGTEFSGPISRIAYPNLSEEAARLSLSIRRFVPNSIALVTLLAISTVVLGNKSPADAGSPALQAAQWLAKAALSSGVVLPALLGLLGALASVLRRFQHLSAASLLDPGLRSKNQIEIWLGFIAGSGVGFLAGLYLPDAGLFAAAFLVGYSTEIAFSFLDLIIVRLSKGQIFGGQTSQFNTVLKSQTAIADTVTQIHGRIEQIQGNVTLDPFDGAIIVTVHEPGGPPMPYGDHSVLDEMSDKPVNITGPKLSPGSTYEVRVAIDKDAASAHNAAFERVVTGKGPQTGAVSFEIGLNSRDIRFMPKAETLTIEPQARSASFVSSFVAPNSPGRCDIFAEVHQKNRLVQSALLLSVIETTRK